MNNERVDPPELPNIGEPKGEKESSNQLTSCQQRLIKVILVSSMLPLGMLVSILIPFYPLEAEKRNITASQYGPVFGVFDLAAFLITLRTEWCSTFLGPKSMLLIGEAMACSSAAGLGLLMLVEDTREFLAVSVLSRIIGGFSKVFISVSVMSMSTALFPDSAAELILWGNYLYEVGYYLAPAIGGFLYELQGLYLPFSVIGAVILILFLLGIFCLPGGVDNSLAAEHVFHIDRSILRLCKVWIGLFGCALAQGCAGFLSATLQPSTRFLQYSVAYIGVAFSCLAYIFTITASIMRSYCDRGTKPLPCMLFGTFLAALGMIIVGISDSHPVLIPGVSTPFQVLTVIVIGLVILGWGIGTLFTPCLFCMTDACLEEGFPNTLTTRSYTNSLFVFASSLGGFLGPTAGCISYDVFGFLFTSITASVMFGVVAILVGLFLYLERMPERSQTRPFRFYGAITAGPGISMGFPVC